MVESSSYQAGPHLLRDIWAFSGVSIVVVILRIVAKTRIRKLGWDDILIIFALVSDCVLQMSPIYDNFLTTFGTLN